MTPSQIRNFEHWELVSLMVEIAAQLSELSEIARTRHVKAQKRIKTMASVSRNSSSRKRFFVERWKSAVDENMLSGFIPKEGFKALDSIAVDESTEGKLGTDDNAVIRRIQ